ncbi:MAG: ATP-binding protein, partial [Bryobacteraceae bacterium]
DYFLRSDGQVLRYTRPMGGVAMDRLSRQYARARKLVADSRSRDWRRGFIYTVASVSGVIWLASMAVLLYWAHRISRPIQQLTGGLASVAAGDLSARVRVQGDDEIASAIRTFNHMAAQLQQSRERLIHVTQLASWQALARKMAHEVKNSLTPIRLTMEEMAARRGGADTGFLEQAAQIVADEVTSLERRVRAFSDFAAEPPVTPAELDVNAMVEERLTFLKTSHPEVTYATRLAGGDPVAFADPDLVKGVLTNLLENAAEAARAGGAVLASTATDGSRVFIEVHDSGPGLTANARGSLFEPTISFKKGGMGLGLSIARKSALLCGGDLTTIEGELAGAAFRVTLPRIATDYSPAVHDVIGVSDAH